jgi:hypothetical protein
LFWEKSRRRGKARQGNGVTGSNGRGLDSLLIAVYPQRRRHGRAYRCEYRYVWRVRARNSPYRMYEYRMEEQKGDQICNQQHTTDSFDECDLRSDQGRADRA